MRIQIQSQQPYQNCLRWDIQNAFYSQQGLNAFTSAEVPAYVTSNYIAARQKAEILLNALPGMGLAEDEPLRILETGGGSGWFAWNFLRAFDLLCQQRKLNYASRLHYILSDYSSNSLASLASNPYFEPLISQGRLSLLALNLVNPSQGTTLAGETIELAKASLIANISNYSHCTLPAMILRFAQGRFHLRHVSLYYAPPDMTDQTDLQQTVQLLSPAEQLNFYQQRWIEEVETFVPVTLAETVTDPVARRVLEQISRGRNEMTMLYSADSWQAVDRMMTLLRPGGLMLISDKATVSAEAMQGLRPCPITVHGNSIAHFVNFPLLAELARAQGYAALHTDSLPDELQTLMLVKAPDPSARLEQAFARHYLELNLNLMLCNLKSACQALYKHQHLEAAAQHYAKLLSHDPLNAESLYVLARHYLALQQYPWVLHLVAMPNDDCLGFFNFQSLRAQALEGLKDYAAAAAACHDALSDFGRDITTWCVLGRCHLALNQPEGALMAFSEVLRQEPEHAEALAALKALKARP